MPQVGSVGPGRAPSRLGHWLTILAPLAVAGLVIGVIWPGLMPDVGYWDTAEFQTILPIMGTAHPTGYPTYVLLGWLVNLLLSPLGEPAFRINVLSLLCVAGAAAATVVLVGRLTGRIAIGAAAGLATALAPATWRLATHADPHTLHLALVAILLLVLVRWEQARDAQEPKANRWLVMASVVFGLAVGNHSLTLLLALPVGLYVLSVEPGILRRWRFMATCAAALALTIVALYLELPLRAGPFRAALVYGHPETWNGFWYVVLAQQFQGALVDPLGDLPRKIGDLGQLATAQFGVLAPAIPIAFLATAIRHWRYALLTGSAMLITLIFNASYVNADISRYYLGPTLWAWTWLGVLGALIADQVLGGRSQDLAEASELPDVPATSARRRVLTPWSWNSAGALAIGLVMLAPTIGAAPLRAAVADSSHDMNARRWVTAVLANAQPNAVIVSWWSTSTVLWYAQFVDHLRLDVSVIDDRTRLDLNYGEATDVIARFLGTRPVYVIRANGYDLGLVTARFDIVPISDPSIRDVYQVVGPRGAGG